MTRVALLLLATAVVTVSLPPPLEHRAAPREMLRRFICSRLRVSTEPSARHARRMYGERDDVPLARPLIRAVYRAGIARTKG